MRLFHKFPGILALIAIIILLSSCSGDKPPTPGREINLKEGVSIKLAEGWVGQVEGTDWTQWERVKKGRADDPWVIPPITATNEGSGPLAGDERRMSWRFKGVKGTFNPAMSPTTSAYPVPKGLWSLDPLKLELQETETKILPWPSTPGLEATCRLYENTHGTGAASALWHTYTVTFNVGENAYEFVMSIPDNADFREWVKSFWASIENLSFAESGK